MRNSLKQMLRTPMRTALFFLLLTAASLLLTLGAALFIRNRQAAAQYEEQFITIGTVRQKADSFGQTLVWDAAQKDYSIIRTAQYDSYLTVEDLLDRPFYLTERDTNYRRVLDRFLAARNRSLTPFLECSDTSFLIRILENNRGVSLLPWYAVEQSVGQGKLSLIQVADFHVTLYRQIFSHKEKWCSREMDEFVRTVQELEAL